MSHAAAHRRQWMTEEEFLALPETTQRVELVDGEVRVSPSQFLVHRELVIRLAEALRAWARSRPAPRPFAMAAPSDVRFGPRRILQPDVYVILAGMPLRHRGPVDRIPDLCVEVLSDDEDYDRQTKRLLYGEAGVHEYWCVHPGGLVERWTGKALAEHEELDAGELRTPLLPGFALGLDELLADL